MVAERGRFQIPENLVIHCVAVVNGIEGTITEFLVTI